MPSGCLIARLNIQTTTLSLPNTECPGYRRPEPEHIALIILLALADMLYRRRDDNPVMASGHVPNDILEAQMGSLAQITAQFLRQVRLCRDVRKGIRSSKSY